MRTEDLTREKVVAILRAVPDGELLDVTGALHAAGVRLLEIAFDRGRTPEANAARISLVVRAELPGLHLGAGTVLTPDEAAAAADAGAEFVLSPDTRGDVIRATKRLGLLSIPGALTPSEVGRARDDGADVVKIFPAAALGPGYLRELHGPMPDVPFCAVGGVSVANARAFLDSGAVCVGVGSALVPRAGDGAIDLLGATEIATALVGAAHAGC